MAVKLNIADAALAERDDLARDERVSQATRCSRQRARNEKWELKQVTRTVVAPVRESSRP